MPGGSGGGLRRRPLLNSFRPLDASSDVQRVAGMPCALCGGTPQPPNHSAPATRSLLRMAAHLGASARLNASQRTQPSPGPQRAPRSISCTPLEPNPVPQDAAAGSCTRSMSKRDGGTQPRTDASSAHTVVGKESEAVGATPHLPTCSVFQGSASSVRRSCTHPGSGWPVLEFTDTMPSHRVLLNPAPQRSPNHSICAPGTLQPGHLTVVGVAARRASCAAGTHPLTALPLPPPSPPLLPRSIGEWLPRPPVQQAPHTCAHVVSRLGIFLGGGG